MQLNDVTTDIKKIERRIKKVFTYGERADKLALSRMMNYQMETYKWEIIEAKKEMINNQLEKLENQKKGLEQQREKLERDSNPFDFSMGKLPLNNEAPSSSVLKGSHSVTVGGNTCKGHSRAKIILDRAEVMKKIGEGLNTNKELATFFKISVYTMRDKTKELGIPRKGQLSGLVYLTDEQDGFKSYNEYCKKVNAKEEGDSKEVKESPSMLESGQKLVQEEGLIPPKDDEDDGTFDGLLRN